MREFFRGWRRKVGCVTLLISCVLMVGWMRSRAKLDTVYIPVFNRLHLVVSARGELAWLSADWLGYEAWQWQTTDVTTIKAPTGSAAATFPDIMERLHRGLEDDARMRGEKNGRSPRLWLISYRSAILALTLLSAYLILWGPRKRTSAISNPLDAIAVSGKA